MAGEIFAGFFGCFLDFCTLFVDPDGTDGALDGCLVLLNFLVAIATVVFGGTRVSLNTSYEK